MLNTSHIQTPTVLGINPGAKYLGIAVFHGSELRDWRIKAVNGKWSDAKMVKMHDIITSLIRQHEPQAIAIKKLNPSRSSKQLDRLVDMITEIAWAEKIEVYKYSIEDMKKYFSREKKLNKKQLAEIIASIYPILFHELNSERNHLNPYHIRMFEAVGLGAMCSCRHIDYI